MAIQFACISCGKAIEVDQEWAHRLVECPYCHETVTAPGFSSYPAAQKARPAQFSSPSGTEQPVPFALPMQEVGRGNKLALVALLLACASLALLIWINVASAGVLMERLGPNPTMTEMQQEVNSALNKQEGWVIRLVFGLAGWLLMWIAALVCSIIAVFRRGRRGTAIAAIAVSLLPIFMFCISLLAGL